MLRSFLFVAALIGACILHAQVAPSIEWQKCFGGIDDDRSFSVQQTTDGGYIMAGFSQSSDGDVLENHGSNDYWIVKLDSTGNILWQKSYGGSNNDVALSIQQISDGGFVIAGNTLSNDGDVSGHHGNQDYWILRLDSDGNLIWQKCFGGSGNDEAHLIRECFDNGFIIAGASASNDGDVSGNHGNYDYWIIRLDTSGNLIWQKSLGGSNPETLPSIVQNMDGGFIIAGNTSSNDGDVSGNHGNYDYWVVKLDSDGNLIWQKSLGGANDDLPNSIQQTIAGEYILAGYSNSSDGDVSGNHGGRDYWLVKVDTFGSIIWQKSLGGTANDWASSVQQTVDGGFIISGYTYSIDGEISNNHGGTDSWIVKINTSGNIIWEKSLGGTNHDWAHFIQQTTDCEFIITGTSLSNDGDVSGNHGNYDYWIVKLSRDTLTGIGSLLTNSLSIHPNPVQNLLTITLAAEAANAIIRVYDLQGRIQDCGFRVDDFGLRNSIQLNTENLPAGFYTLQVTSNKTGEIKVGKFVKQQ